VKGRTVRALAVLALLAAAIAPTSAQEVNYMGAVAQENAENLKDYSWKQRIEIKVGGESQSVTLNQVRYDFEGALERTPIGGESDKKKVRGPVRKSMAKKKKKKAAQLKQDLRQLIDQYTHMTPETLAKITAKGNVWAGRGAEGNLTRIQASGVVRLADALDIWIDSSSRRMRKFEVMSSLEGAPVHVVAEFSDLEGGPTYPAHATVKTEVDGKPMVITLENFDYIRQGG